MPIQRKYCLACSALWFAARTVLFFQIASAVSASNWIIERVERVDYGNATKAMIPPAPVSQPAAGQGFIHPETGLHVTRISDVSAAANPLSSNPPAYDGSRNQGLTNGYSRYPNVNITGEYALAFGTSPMAAIYRLSDLTFLGVLSRDGTSATKVGDSGEPRWDRSGRPGTEYLIYFTQGAGFYQQDVRLGPSSSQLLYNFGSSVQPTNDGDGSNDNRYRAFKLANGTCVVLDVYSNTLLPGIINDSPAGLDISPDGLWLQVLGTNHRFYRISDLQQNITTNPVPLPASGGHGGWSLDYNGDYVAVWLSASNDWFMTFNPATGEQIKIMNMSETGWGLGEHIARITASDKKGWCLVSTYCPSDNIWAYNQLFMLEIKPSVDAIGNNLPAVQRPRIWRLGHIMNYRYKDGNDIGGYFGEGFANLDMQGNNVYWGGNWLGTDNLELYRMELPTNWAQYLSDNANNYPPNIAALGNQSVDGGANLNFSVSASDPENQAITWTANRLPAGATFSNGVFNWNPTNDQWGTHTVTFNASDGIFGSTKAVKIGVRDATPPTAPGALTGEAISQSEIRIYWNAAQDPNSGVAKYKVFRNAILAGTSTGLSYMDEGLSAATSYSYTVIAVNGDGVESAPTDAISVSSGNDVTGPALVRAATNGSTSQVRVAFNEPLNSAAAQDSANYNISGGVSVLAAALQADGLTVILTTSEHALNTSYVLEVHDVRDSAGNLVEPGCQISYWVKPLAPGNYIMERVKRVEAAQTGNLIIPPANFTISPAVGESWITPVTGHRITRLTDVSTMANPFSSNPPNYDGSVSQGLTAGYSRYPCVNITGEYALAFGTTPMAALIRLSDNAFLRLLTQDGTSNTKIGDKGEPRWDRTGKPGTEYLVYFHINGRFYCQDVRLGPDSTVLIYDFEQNVVATNDGDASNDGHYRSFQLADGSIVVLDVQTKTLLPGSVMDSTAGVDISPDGKWLQVLGPNHRFYRISDLKNNDTSKPVPLPPSGGHGGWGFDYAGNCVAVYQNSSTDWFQAFNPDTREVIRMINMAETGWGVGQHMARITAMDKKGWVLISTYCPNDNTWAYNQLFMLEIKPTVLANGAEVADELKPRIWRLGHTYNYQYKNGDNVGGYFAEAFANMDMQGNNVYWGGNWFATDNLELYRMELPENWADVLATGIGPAPTPIPTSTPTPIPTPIPTPSPTPTSGSFFVVTYPTPGMPLQPGMSYNVTWNSYEISSSSHVWIRLFRGGSYRQTLSSGTINDGVFTWTVPSGLSLGTDYQIRLNQLGNTSVYADSLHFAVGTTAPTPTPPPFNSVGGWESYE